MPHGMNRLLWGLTKPKKKVVSLRKGTVLRREKKKPKKKNLFKEPSDSGAPLGSVFLAIRNFLGKGRGQPGNRNKRNGQGQIKR